MCHDEWVERISCQWMPHTRPSLIFWPSSSRGFLGDLIRPTCRETFGCPIKAVGFATIVIPSLTLSTADTIVDFVAEYSVASAQPIQFLPRQLTTRHPARSGRGFGCVTIASSNGRKTYEVLIMGMNYLTRILVPHHQQQVLSAANLLILPIVEVLLLAQCHNLLSLIALFGRVLI